MSANDQSQKSHLLASLARLFDFHPAATLGQWNAQARHRRVEQEMFRTLGPHLLRDIGVLDIPEDGSEPKLSASATACLTQAAPVQHPSVDQGGEAPCRTARTGMFSFSGTRFWI